jgi:hypothetical protein
MIVTGWIHSAEFAIESTAGKLLMFKQIPLEGGQIGARARSTITGYIL